MDNSLKWWVGLYSVGERSFLGDIFDDGKVQLIFGNIGVSISDRLSFRLGSDSRNYRMTLFQQQVEDMCSDEASAS